MKIVKVNGQRQLRFSLGGHKFIVFKEEPGIISPNSCWVCFSGSYMYESESLLGLVWTVYNEWQEDFNLVS